MNPATDKPKKPKNPKRGHLNKSDQEKQPKRAGNTKRHDGPPLGIALLSTLLSLSVFSFLSGCLFGIWIHSGKNDLGAADVLPYGIEASTVVFPATAVLAFIGLPLFRLLIRRGHTGADAYIAGACMLAVTGAIAVTIGHLVAGYLPGENYRDAMLGFVVCGPLAGTIIWVILRSWFAEQALLAEQGGKPLTIREQQKQKQKQKQAG